MGIENVLGSQWNILTPGKGVKMPLKEEPNVLTKVRERYVIDTDSILKTPKEGATTINTDASTGVTLATPKVMTRVDAKSEADR